MKLKSTEEVLIKILRRMFMKDLVGGKLCASDTLTWIIRDRNEVDKYFEEWLEMEGYAE